MGARKSVESSQRGKLTRKSEADIQAYVDSPKFQKDAARSKDMGADPSPKDLQVIPEFGGFNPALFRPVKYKITTRIDGDILQWLKGNKDGYQPFMNTLLREAMEREPGRNEGRPVSVKKNGAKARGVA